MSNVIQRSLTNSRMSQVVSANGVIYLAGQVSDSKNASVKEQTNEILARIDKLLASADADKTRLLSANIWLSDTDHFEEFNAVWDAWVPEGHAPARACVQALLMVPGYDVEVAITALAR